MLNLAIHMFYNNMTDGSVGMKLSSNGRLINARFTLILRIEKMPLIGTNAFRIVHRENKISGACELYK